MAPLKAQLKSLLRKSERYTKTDMVYVARGGFWLTAGQAVSMTLSLLLAIAFANLLPKDVYGNYRYILSIAGIISAFTLTGMGKAVTQGVARNLDGVFRTGFRVQLRWSLLALLAASVGAIYYGINGNRIVAISLLIVGACTPVIEATSLYGPFLVGKKDFRNNAIYGMIRSLIPITTLMVTMLLTQDVVVIVAAYFLSHAATSTALYLDVLRRYRPPQEDDRSNVAYGKHVSLTNLLSIVAANLDKVLVFHYLGAVQLAVYGIAFSVPAQMKVLVKMLTTLIFPKMSSSSLETIRSAIRPKAVRVFFLFVAIIAVYIGAAPFLFHLVFPQYADAIVFSQALALGYVFSPSILYSQALYALKMQKEIYVFKIGTSCIRILLLFLLLPRFGIWGAVYAFFLTNAASFFISYILFQRIDA